MYSVLAAVDPADDVGLLVFGLVGLFGGAHCLGMCGPLVTTYAERLDDGDGRVGGFEIRQHLLFNLGRTVSYALVGGLFGLLGALLLDAAAVVALASSVRAVMGIGIGLLIVATGLSYLRRGSARELASVPGFAGVFGRVAGHLQSHVDRWVRGPRIVGLGMVHGLLPCPILYPAFLYALARGSPLWGVLSLGALGLGTVPAVFAYGTAFQSVSPATRVRLHRVLGVVFVVLGYLPLAMGLNTVGVSVPMPPVPFWQPLG